MLNYPMFSSRGAEVPGGDGVSSVDTWFPLHIIFYILKVRLKYENRNVKKTILH